ncbi:site-specific integrase [Pseudomonas sp. LS-2]|uniref:site-specific integrase n=1 Tax=Pseudomonas sp. LS-2 TaxID=2315859 RepID=UPI000E748A21|nr:site-specific integrase [Pseudomonas sp. LS-2]RJX77825.1 site-specific integrase [Pseudomonas sp. LS-2]
MRPNKVEPALDFSDDIIEAFHQKNGLHFIIGDEFSIEHESLDRAYHVDFKAMLSCIDNKIVNSFRYTLASCISACYAISTIATYCEKLKELARLIENNLRTNSHPIYYLNECEEVWKEFASWLRKNGNMKSFLCKCNTEDGLLWEDEYGLVIDSITMPSSRGKQSARASDPVMGALTSNEIRDLTYAICNAYKEGLIHLEHLATFFLALVLGYRKSQILNIKVEDLTYSNIQKGWLLKIEVIKQKLKSKATYLTVKLPPLVNSLLDHLVPICKERNKTFLIHKSTGGPGLIISNADIKALPNKRCNASVIMERLEIAAYQQGVRTSRVAGGKINLNFIRFKHTLLTRAAVHGATAHELMYLGLHSTLESAQSYIDSTPEAQIRIKEELGPALSSIANLFLGSPFEGGYERAIKEMPGSIKRHYGIAEAKPIGVCGSTSNCTDHAPIACLLCPSFQPFRDAPFGEYKAYLAHERDSQPDVKVKSIIIEYIAACDTWIDKLNLTPGNSNGTDSI